MVVLKIKDGIETQISNCDYDRVKDKKWYIEFNGMDTPYVVGYVIENGKRKKVRLHRWLLNAPENKIVDHIDHNALNNQRENLRLATHAQNRHNSRKLQECTSKYMGVSYDRDRGKWSSSINFSTRRVRLYHGNDEIRAAELRDCACIVFRKEYANLNFPDKKYSDNDLEYVKNKVHEIFLKSTTSQYIGVYYDKYSGKYISKYKRIKLGRYETEIEAARIHDMALLHIDPDRKKYTNFNYAEYSKHDIDKIGIILDDRKNKKLSSKYMGVNLHKNGKYRSNINIVDHNNKFGRKCISLGSYDSEIEAAKMYDAALTILRPDKKYKLNFKDEIDNAFLLIAQEYINREYKKSSKHKGVAFSKAHNKWIAYLRFNGKKVHIGYFKTEEEANKARKAKEIELGLTT